MLSVSKIQKKTFVILRRVQGSQYPIYLSTIRRNEYGSVWKYRTVSVLKNHIPAALIARKHHPLVLILVHSLVCEATGTASCGGTGWTWTVGKIAGKRSANEANPVVRWPHKVRLWNYFKARNYLLRRTELCTWNGEGHCEKQSV